MPRIIRALGIIALTVGALSYVSYSLEDQRLQAEYLSSQTQITSEIRQEARDYAERNTSYTPAHMFGQVGAITLGAILAAGSRRSSTS
ncbi:MAG: hypothetical protein ABH864_05885 [archaeon]